MKLIVTIAFICFHSVTCGTPNSADRYLGATDLQIGFGDNCHLFWNGEEGSSKNAEFRCRTSKGDPMWIKKRGEDLYEIGSGDCYLYFNVFEYIGQEGTVTNAKFLCGFTGSEKADYAGIYLHLFYIQPRPNGMWAITMKNPHLACPLYWKGSISDSKNNAEFRCGSPSSDLFWIKGSGCKPTNVQILDTGDNVKYDGEEIIGVTTAASCSGGQHNLQLTESKELTEELTLGTTKTTERNWEVSTSVTVEASVKFLGTGGSVAATVGASGGGSTSWGSSRDKTTGTSTTQGSGVEITYKTPGAAMVLGFVRRYKFDNSHVKAKVTVTCKKGYSFTYDTYFSLKTKTFGRTFYKHYLGEFLPGKCTESRADCVNRWHFSSYKSVLEARNNFVQCFPAEFGKVTKK